VKTTLSPWSAINANNHRPATHLASPRRRRIYRSRIMYKADSTSFIFFLPQCGSCRFPPRKMHANVIIYIVRTTHISVTRRSTAVYNNMYKSHNVALVRSNSIIVVIIIVAHKRGGYIHLHTIYI